MKLKALGAGDAAQWKTAGSAPVSPWLWPPTRKGERPECYNKDTMLLVFILELKTFADDMGTGVVGSQADKA